MPRLLPTFFSQQGHFDFLNRMHTLNQFYVLETFPRLTHHTYFIYEDFYSFNP